MPPLFASKQTLARIEYLRATGNWRAKKGTHSVKSPAVCFTFNQTTNHLERRQKGDQAKHGPTLKTTLATAFSPMRVKITLTRRLV